MAAQICNFRASPLVCTLEAATTAVRPDLESSTGGDGDSWRWRVHCTEFVQDKQPRRAVAVDRVKSWMRRTDICQPPTQIGALRLTFYSDSRDRQ